MKPFRAVIQELVDVLPDLGGNMEKTAKFAELFGIRGQGAAAQFVGKFAKATDAAKLDKLAEELQNASGAAKEMSKIRLDTTIGQFTIMKSAIEALTIESFTALLGSMKGFATGAGKAIQDVAIAMQYLVDPTGAPAALQKRFDELGQTAKDVAYGIRDGFKLFGEVAGWAKEKVVELADYLGAKLGEGGARKITKIITAIVLISAALAPVMLILMGVGFLITSVLIPAVTGLGTILMAAFSPWGLALVAAIGLIWAFRDQILAFGKGVIAGLKDMWTPIKEAWEPVWESIKSIWNVLVSAILGDSKALAKGAGEAGRGFGKGLGDAIVRVLQIVKPLLEGFAKSWKNLHGTFRAVRKSLGYMFEGFGKVIAALTGTKEGAMSTGQIIEKVGQWMARMIGVVAGAVGFVAHVIGFVASIIAPIIGGIRGVIDGIVGAFTSLGAAIGDIVQRDWKGAFKSLINFLLEIVKIAVEMMGAIVGAAASAADAIASIFGKKDLGAAKWQKDFHNNVIKEVDALQAKLVVREKAKTAERPKVAPVAAPQVTALPSMPGIPAGVAAVGAAAGGVDTITGAIDRLGASLGKRPMKANIELETIMKIGEETLAEAVRKVTKDLEAREGAP
jgi:hypothetical protein